VDDGVTTVIASPHQLGSYGRQNSAAVIRDKVKQLTARLEDHGVPLEVAPGADVRIDERLLHLLDTDELATAADAGRHLLLELPHELYVDPLALIHRLSERGIQPIMTHPERYSYLQGSSGRLRSWMSAGAVLQITAGSLVGEFGRRALKEAWRLVHEGWASLVATDAHGSDCRAPRVTAAIEMLEHQSSREAARLLCGENPLRVLRGQQLSPLVG
jgi:protein-tyrosine phosphatase